MGLGLTVAEVWGFRGRAVVFGVWHATKKVPNKPQSSGSTQVAVKELKSKQGNPTSCSIHHNARIQVP